MIKGTTQLLGVIGDPITHSLSPIIHNTAIRHLGLDYAYVPFRVGGEDLSTAVAGLAAIGVVGFNVTIPHKQAIVPLLRDISPFAEGVGAVNTVWRQKDGWSGTNTDVEGFLAPLIDFIPTDTWRQRRVLVLGCGGAARSVVVGCSQLGCSSLVVFGRNKSKLEAFYGSWLNSPLKNTLSQVLSIHPWQQLMNYLPTVDLIVNTTPIGMHPISDTSPLGEQEMDLIASHAVVYDLIYTPSPTKLLRQAQLRGLVIIDGQEMLIHQGAAAFKIWTRQSPPIEVMRMALKTTITPQPV